MRFAQFSLQIKLAVVLHVFIFLFLASSCRAIGSSKSRLEPPRPRSRDAPRSKSPDLIGDRTMSLAHKTFCC